MSFFKNLKFVQKIGILTVSFFVFLVIIGITSIEQISNVNSRVTELNNSRLLPIVKLESLEYNIEKIRTLANTIMDDGNDDAQKKPVQKEMASSLASVNSQLSAYKNNPSYKSVINGFNQFQTAVNSFIKTNGAGAVQRSISPANASLSISNINASGPPETMKNLDTTKNTVITALNKIINQEVANANTTYLNSKSVYHTTLVIIISLLVICTIIAFLLSAVITGSIVVPVRNVTNKLKEISESNGDLTQRINYISKDEIGELSSSFDSFIDKLQAIIREVASSAETISSSSEHLNDATVVTTKSLEGIAKTVSEIAAGSSQGAALTEEATAKLIEAANFSESTSNTTKFTTDNTRKVQDAAEGGSAKISEVVSSISEIATSSKEVSIVINDLNDSSKKIGDIIQIITAISAQTNLLALNAAIEAARAGEAGKGFSVVAEEIRKLADQSNEAAQEISKLVEENQLKSSSAVNSVNLVEEKVTDGVKKASEVSVGIQNILLHIQNIVSEIEQIDRANEEQAQSTKEMEQAIGSIAATSGEIAEGTENISSNIEEQLSTMSQIEKTTEQLTQMAKNLKKLTAGFRVQ